MPAFPKPEQRTAGAMTLLLFVTLAMAVAVAILGTGDREVAGDSLPGTGFGPVLNGASLRPPLFLTGFSGPVA